MSTCIFSLIQKNCELYNECFPLRKVKSCYRNRKIWLTDCLKKSIRFINKLYVKYIKKPSLYNIKIYKLYRNKLSQVMRKAERDHFASLLRQYRGDLSKSWFVIKEVVNKKKKLCNNTKFIINGKETVSKEQIAEAFKNFYIITDPSLPSNIQQSDINPISYIDKEIKKSIFIHPTNVYEITDVITCPKGASAWYDSVIPKIEKLSCNCFMQALTHIINLSFAQVVVTNEVKIAKVFPLFKSDDTTIISNYRPVSV